MDDLESKLSAVFSSPESMEQIKNLAKSLSGAMGGGNSQAGDDAQSAAEERQSFGEPMVDARMMQLFSRVMGEYSKPSEAGAIISALRPYLSDERVKKLDKAMSIAKIARLAKTVLPELGGDNNV